MILDKATIIISNFFYSNIAFFTMDSSCIWITKVE